MNTLVIGGGGFVGAYLIAELNAGGHRVHATKLPGEEIRGTCTIHDLDILQPEAVSALLIGELARQGLSGGRADFLLPHAREIQAGIRDPDLRDLHLMAE